MAFQMSDRSGCIRVSSGNWPPISVIRGPYYGGIAVDIVRLIAKLNGMCVKFVTVPENNWGLMLHNGSWTGLMGQMLRGESDMIGTLLFISESRSVVVDFSESLFTQDHRILYKTPQVEPNVAGFLMPFSPLVWMTLFAMVIGAILSFMVLFFLYDTAREMWGPSSRVPISQSARHEPGWRSFNFTLGSLLAQAPSWRPNPSIPIIILSTLWLFVSFIVAIVYSSNLVSMLVIPKIPIPFDTIEELADKTQVKIMFPGGATLEQKAWESPPDSALGRVVRRSVITNDWTFAVNGVLKGTHCGLGNEIQLDVAIHIAYSTYGSCILTMTKTGFLTGWQMSYVFPKRSPLKKIFNKSIIRLREGGIIDFLLRRTLSNVTYCKMEKYSGAPRPLTFWDVAGIFTVLGGGLLLSAIVFVLEYFRKSDEGIKNVK